MSRHEYEPQIGALLRMAWESLQADMQGGLREAGFDDLRDVHSPIMQYPPMDGQRPSDIRDRTGLSKQAVNGLLRDLERLGYLTLEHDPDDGRARLIRYTERGWAFFDLGSRLSADVGDRWRSEVGADTYQAFERSLRLIVARDPEHDSSRPRT